MPIGRYFLFTGSVLFALLLLIDWQFPPSSVAAARSDIDRSTIRIHSAHRWPGAVVFDTTQPTIVPPVTAMAEAPAPAPRPPREAFAMASEPAPAAKPEPVRPAKSHHRRNRTARAPAGHVGPEPFGFRSDWFGSPRREVSAFPRNGAFGSRGMWSMNW